MNRSKSRSKRSQFPLASSQSFRSEMDLIDDGNLNQIPFLNRSCSPTSITKSSFNDADSGTLSDTDADCVSANGIKNSQFRNGFSKSSFLGSENDGLNRPKLVNLGSAVNNLTHTKTHSHPNPSNAKFRLSHHDSSEQSENPPGIINSKRDGLNLPHYEESIIDGFSVIAFEDRTDLELTVPVVWVCCCVFAHAAALSLFMTGLATYCDLTHRQTTNGAAVALSECLLLGHSSPPMWKLVPFEEKGEKMIHHRLPTCLSALPITSAFYAGAYALAHARFSANWGRGGYACPLRSSASREKFCCSPKANFLSATKAKITIFPSPLWWRGLAVALPTSLLFSPLARGHAFHGRFTTREAGRKHDSSSSLVEVDNAHPTNSPLPAAAVL
ncbi:hypothetical protein ACTXT7_008188 [Hymenolepis weldensis]